MKDQGKIEKLILDYFKFVNPLPYDEVQIYIIYDSWRDAYNNVKKAGKLREDMSGIFPYIFYVSCVVSEQSVQGLNK